MIVTNDEANRIFSLGSAIKLGRDKKIHCRSSEIENSIKKAVMRSCATADGKDTVAEHFQLVENNLDQLISVEISPLRDSGAEIAPGFNGALITLIDFSSDLEINASKIASAYKLTPSEQEVCHMVVRGTPDSVIAESRNVSPETIKSQLKSIYRKTRSKGRVELTRLALKADPPVR